MTIQSDSLLADAYLALNEDNRLFELSLQESASIIASRCATALVASRASIWLFSEGHTELSCLAHYIVGKDQYDTGIVANAGSYPQLFDTLVNGRIINVFDVESDPRAIELIDSYFKPHNIQSLLGSTLRHQGVAQGVFCVEMAGKTRFWTKDESMFVTSVADMFSQRLIFEKLARREAQHEALFESSNDGIIVFGGGLFVDVNPAMCRIFGASREQLVGRSPIEFSPEFQNDGQPSGPKAMWYITACLEGTPQRFEWLHLRLDGTEFDAEVTLSAIRIAGEDTLFSSVRDITHKKETERNERVAQKEIEYRAAHDSLTGLLNREKLHSHINTLLDDVQGEDTSFRIALFLFDLNRFKEVNDTLGHATGDKVLIELAVVLEHYVEAEGGKIFRLGGDEFVAVFDSKACSMAFAEIEALLNRCLKTPIDVDDIRIEMAASMGVALYPNNGKDSHELLRCADVAMYHAKNNDGASSWYDPQNDLNNKRRLAMMVELGTAIRDDQLVLHFQPRIHLKTGEITGCEALLRWNHPKLGMVPPNEFIPLAEMTELIHPLSQWVLEAVIRQIVSLCNKGYNVPLAMNISARNLTDSQLVESIEKLVGSDQFDPRLLELEITESALINHPLRVLRNLSRLDALGLSLAIDDFGTGYSSLSYLKRLPVDTLKIDQSFVQGILSDESDAVIVESTIQLGHNFGLTVVAEGVEDQETLNALAASGCDQAQGYFIARPMPAEELEWWLENYPNQRPGTLAA